MAYKISWTNIAFQDYQKVIEYLIAEWSLTDAVNFENTVKKKLANLSRQPFIGIVSQKNPFVISILLSKYNRLYYRVKEETIELLNVFDTRQNPDRNPF